MWGNKQGSIVIPVVGKEQGGVPDRSYLVYHLAPLLTASRPIKRLSVIQPCPCQ